MLWFAGFPCRYLGCDCRKGYCPAIASWMLRRAILVTCCAVLLSEYILPMFAGGVVESSAVVVIEAHGAAPAHLNNLSITLKAFPDANGCQHLQAGANWMGAFLLFSDFPLSLLNRAFIRNGNWTQTHYHYELLIIFFFS